MANILKGCRVRQIYYDKFYEPRLDPGFVPYYNEEANKFLENQVILDLWASNDHQGYDYYGVLSWKFKKKRSKDSWWIDHGMNNHPGYDVYSFFGDWQHKNVWLVGDIWHKNFSIIGQMLFHKLGYAQDVTKLKTTPIYMNYWIARNEVFEKYCLDVLMPAMELLKTDKDLIELCDNDAKYQNNNIANSEQCMKIFGKPYYTYYPFVLERCMSTFVALENLKCKHI